MRRTRATNWNAHARVCSAAFRPTRESTLVRVALRLHHQN